MEQINLHQSILLRKQKLNEVSEVLKKDFIGLNEIIDEVINLLTPWYLFPDAQMRPTVINMWGLTGSGKTALVHRIIELLEHKRLYVQMDMGEFESDSASWIKSIFTDDLEFLHEQPGVICFDEFQFARTLNKEGNELGKDKLRVIWDMLDNGKVNYIPGQNSYYMIRAEQCLLRLLKCSDRGIIIRDGKVVEGLEEFLFIFGEYYFESNTRFEEAVTANYFLSRDFIDGLFYLYCDDSITRAKLKEKLEKCDLKELQRLIIEAADTRTAVKQLDLSKSIIFVLGNLDEAYYMSHSMNPDISADELYEATKKITIAHIKSALQKRFRNEQIARLGNNHVIYRSFTNQHFRELINTRLDEIRGYVKNKFQFEILFHDSVTDAVYSEGVYPAQGTRPVFTTIKNLIEGSISKVVLEIIEKDLKTSVVEWSFADEKFVFVFKDELNNILNIYEEKVILKIGSLRKPENPELQAHTAVHEAGHAILAALTLKIIPSLVVSKTASANSEGFCMVNLPEGPMTRDVLKKDMIIGLGGYVAEKLIFGAGNTSSGVSGDIENVSLLAHQAVKDYAMGQNPLYIRLASSGDNEAFVHTHDHCEEAKQLILEAEKEAEAILTRNKYLLLKMSEHLTENSRMEEREIKNMVCLYASDSWVSSDAFVKKENYFHFAGVVKKQIREMELLKI
jgi:cell division protease FtsH